MSMNILVSLIIYVLCALVQAGSNHANFDKRSSYPAVQGWNPQKNTYPSLKRDSIKFTYKSSTKKVQIGDPYHWLEQAANSTRVQSFIDQQKQLSKQFFDQCDDHQSILKSYDETMDYTAYGRFNEWGPPDDSIFIFAAQPSEDFVNRWYLATQSELDQAKATNFAQIPGRMILDEANLSKDGSLFVKAWQVSNDKKVAAYTVSGGDDGIEIRFMDLTTFSPLNDVIPYGGTMNFVFTPDNQGLLYDSQTYSNSPTRNSKILYHKLGTDRKKDIVIVKEDTKVKTNLWFVDITADNQFLIIYGLRGDDSTYRMYLATLDQKFSENMKFFSLAPDYKYDLQYLANNGNDFYLITNKDGKVNHQIVYAKVDPTKAKLVKSLDMLKDEIPTRTIIPENKQGNIEGWVVLISKKIVLIYLEKAKYTFYLYDLLSGEKNQQLLPDFLGKYYQSDYALNRRQGYVEISSWDLASVVYRIRLTSDDQADVEPVLLGNPSSIDFSLFKTEQHFAKSKDGTLIPFTMSFRKDVQKDAPTFLFYYGSFGEDTIEAYDPYLLPWVRDRNGVSCYLQIRGGGEEGKKWWDAGKLGHRQNSFDDVIAVANYLVSNRIAAAGKIIAQGVNAGGQATMVVGNQAPEGLFGVLLPSEGIFDMLRFPKISEDAAKYISEWGDPKTAEGFDWIYLWSPLHHVNAKKVYPSTLFTPGGSSFEDRAHSFKMVAQLQATCPKNPNPFLLWVPDEDEQSYVKTVNSFQQCFVNQVLGLKRI